jgi:two-component system chemotaxis response regulator CheY
MAYNILIVDDSRTMRKIFKQSFTLSGFEVGSCLEADNGKEALHVLNSSSMVDLILADLNMPVMNGLDMVKVLQKDEKHRGIPVILVTSQGNRPYLEEAYALGVKAYIQKPFSPKVLGDTCTRVVGETNV